MSIFFDFFSKNTIRIANSLDPDETPHFVASHLDPNCLQRPSKSGSSTQRVKDHLHIMVTQLWKEATQMLINPLSAGNEFWRPLQTVWIQMRRHKTWRLIRIQTVCYSDSGLWKKVKKMMILEIQQTTFYQTTNIPACKGLKPIIIERCSFIFVSQF